jgi:hypothetical protein
MRDAVAYASASIRLQDSARSGSGTTGCILLSPISSKYPLKLLFPFGRCSNTGWNEHKARKQVKGRQPLNEFDPRQTVG